MRILAALLLFCSLATFAPASLHKTAPTPAQSRIHFQALPLDRGAPARARLGALTFLQGWVLRSKDQRFGGLSAMQVTGKDVLAVTDAGSVLRFRIPGAQSGPLFIAPIREGPGPMASKRNRDAEAMAVEGSKAWIAFERRNAIWRYDLPGWRAEASFAPAQMADWHPKAGSEAMVRLPDGRFLILSEGEEVGSGMTAALLFEGDPAEAATKATRLRYRAPEGYRLTDAAVLPDGRILFLNRRVSIPDGLSAKLTLGTLPPLKDDVVLSGKEIAILKPPLTVDNMEALSIAQEGGRTIVWMASDDNFSPLQRTLLLKFALD